MDAGEARQPGRPGPLFWPTTVPKAEKPVVLTPAEIAYFDTILTTFIEEYPMTLKCFDLGGQGGPGDGRQQGAGKSMARGLVEAGADVVISSRHEEELRAGLEEILKGTSRRGKFTLPT